jgi:hypothetical protein
LHGRQRSGLCGLEGGGREARRGTINAGAEKYRRFYFTKRRR